MMEIGFTVFSFLDEITISEIIALIRITSFGGTTKNKEDELNSVVLDWGCVGGYGGGGKGWQKSGM